MEKFTQWVHRDEYWHVHDVDQEFIINLKAAKQIGLTISQSMLYRADKVIK